MDLHLAFESRSLNRTESDTKRVLSSQIESISELERIAVEAGGVEEEVDWRFTLLLDTIDEATQRLIQRLPGVFFDKPRPTKPIMMSEAFDFPSVGTTPVPPQLVPPGRQIQSLCTLGRKLRDIIEGKNTGSHEETLKSLESLRNIPVSLHGLNYLMKRQLWGLLDLRDGSGLGFTIRTFLSFTPTTRALIHVYVVRIERGLLYWNLQGYKIRLEELQEFGWDATNSA